MPAENIRLVVFDMAGTTVHDDGLVLDCFLAAAESVGLRATREELNDRMGTSKRAVFEELAKRQLGDNKAGEDLRDKGYERFTRILEGAYERSGIAPVRGAEKVFETLRARGTKCALNTGFYRKVTDIIVDKLGWRSAVDAVVCVDDVAQGRPAPFMIFEAMQRTGVVDVAEVIVTGDTPSDVIAGKRSGARGVAAVLSGAHTGATLRRYPATHILESVRDLPQLIDRMERLR
jgi:phosphonatase-like hydrolase